MMRRIIIIVEGNTEEEFVKKILSPYLYTKDIYDINCFKIKKSNGGLSKYQHLKTDIVMCIHEKNALVTTLIDFYALPKDFPKYEEAKKINNKSDRLLFLEKAILEDVEHSKDKQLPNLLPYIQLHEFEALVFSSIDAIQSLFEKNEVKHKELERIIEGYPNPEDINDSIETAPSKRLQKIIVGYDKITHGTMIIEEAGMNTVLGKCPRFRNWVQTLIEKAQE